MATSILLGLETASIGEQFAVLVELRRAGKIRHLGLSNSTAASSAQTRAALGWQPTHASLLEDLRNIRT